MRILPRTEHGCALLTIVMIGIPVALLIIWTMGIMIYEVGRMLFTDITD